MASTTRDLKKYDSKSLNNKKITLQDEYLKLELMSIQERHIRPSCEIVEKAIDQGAKKYAPRSLAIANKSLQDT